MQCTFNVIFLNTFIVERYLRVGINGQNVKVKIYQIINVRDVLMGVKLGLCLDIDEGCKRHGRLGKN
jgi:hypothetical protein